MGRSLKKPIPRQRLEVVQKALARFTRADIVVSSSALAFSSLLAVVPTAAVGFWYLERVGSTEIYRERVRAFILSHINVLSSDKVSQMYDFLTTATQDQSWSTVSMILLAYSTVNVFWSFWVSLDRVIASARQSEKPVVRRLGLKVALRAVAMLGIPLALVVGLIAEQWAQHDSILNTFAVIPYVGPVYLELTAAGVNLLLFFLIYLLVPSFPVLARDAFKAAVITVVLLILGRWGLSAYTRFAFSTQKLYGAFSAIPLTIAWVQLLWTFILSSALVIRPKA